ncbi:gtrA-like family protein [Paraburkholderia fungorum]|uniref:GtrA-like family protein n=1 Tax=Paraburkholderia fungorum TaxID=134537 RepID=A0AAU8T446_9BURK|nr:GtrA family protein [Paraburkholderia fungorum]AJZ61080.1 gtrA-like family protein [Paraburkholderia fungorum]USU17005.1 GtrA family protein [Paraburkholderia fungorum]USU24950.1 GtrA family protein [Paraburkholderia fungorum]
MSIVRQGISYGVIGALQLALDALTFVGLTAAGLDTPVANLCARLVGAALGFWMNGSVTFAAEGQARIGKAQFSRYAVTWCLTTVVSTLVITLINHSHGLLWAQLAKPVADGLLALAAFLCSKYWIYA